MDIKYLGHSSFFIKGKKASIVTDPYSTESTGLKFPRHTEADIVTVSHDHNDHNDVTAVEGSPFAVRGPGEYDVKGVTVIGLKTAHDTENGAGRGFNTVYKIDIDGLTLVHLGDLGHQLSQPQIEQLGDVDILFVPVGGYYTIDVKLLKPQIAEIEPEIVIPMHYFRPGVDEKLLGNLMPLSVFLKEMGVESALPQPKLSVTKDKLPEEMQIVVLE